MFKKQPLEETDRKEKVIRQGVPGINLNGIFGKTAKSVLSRIKGFKVEKKLCQENGKHLVVASCC